MNKQTNSASETALHFTGAQIKAELHNQGIKSSKAENGALFLYKTCVLTYYNGDRELSKKTLIDLGFDEKKFQNKIILIGEFKIKEKSFFYSLLRGRYLIELNNSINNVITL